MKKITVLILILTFMLMLASCGEDKYPPVESSALESQVVMTINFEEKKYDVKYELYRALFLNLRDSVDGGDITVWSGENKSEYIEKIDTLIKKRATDIYSVLHIANKIGIDVYSKDFDKSVSEYIKVSVEGGYYGNQIIEGFDGDYEKYLASLKEMNLNYAVQDLLIRYSLASEKVFEYYAGYEGEFLDELVQGKLEYTKEDVHAFYTGEDSIRVMRAYLPKAYFSATRAQEIRDKIAEKANYGDEEVSKYIIGTTATAASEIINGEIIGRHNLDDAYYSELEKAAFELSYFEVSEVVEVSSTNEDGYIILYKTVKTDAHFEECYDYVKSVYIQNEVGKIIDTDALGMLENITATTLLTTLDRSQISMD